MRVEIQHLPISQLAGFRLQGAWETTVPNGFARLSEWVSRNCLMGEWMAVYHGNPRDTPSEHQEMDAVISVPSGFVLPPDSQGITLMQLPAACYAVRQVQIADGNFSQPFKEFFDEWLPGSGYQQAEGVCFNRCLSDGEQNGVWDFLIGIPIEKVPSL